MLSDTVTVPEIATMDVYELVASFELADDAACLLYFAAWCTTPSLLDSIFVPFSKAISSNAMQAKSAQRIVKRKGDLVANGVENFGCLMLDFFGVYSKFQPLRGILKKDRSMHSPVSMEETATYLS